METGMQDHTEDASKVFELLGTGLGDRICSLLVGGDELTKGMHPTLSASAVF
jgi:hypothetical protein